MFKYIADSITSSLRTGKDDIINFKALDNFNFVGINELG